jgi:carbon-monoxide dehydrogenase large subunit
MNKLQWITLAVAAINLALIALFPPFDYLPPTAAEVPPMEVLHFETRSPSTLGGFKGVGEGGTIGAPAAIANAVADALAVFGVEVRELPVTPERLFQLLGKSPDR